MTFEQILADLKNKTYKPVYLLMGEEPYFIDIITDYITGNVLTESEKTFNQVILYGKDTDVRAIIDSARRFPMMSESQVVVVKEAQYLEKISDLVFYANNPLKSTILVINYKHQKFDKRLKLYKAINEKGVIFESKRLYDNQIADFIKSYLNKKGFKIEPATTILLIEFLGNDLGKIVKELEKLIIALDTGNKTITSLDVEKNIGISKDYNNFELQKALIKKDILKANRIINYFDKNQKNNPIPLTITSLYYFFSKVLAYHSIDDKSKNKIVSALKINPYFISDYQSAARAYSPAKVESIISILREYDLKSKGVGNISTSPGNLLKELIYKILH